MRRLLFSIVILLCGFQAAALADPLTAPSFWKNQRGSELMITAVSSSGAIRGTFTNRAAGFGCQGIPYPVTGRTTAQQTTFKVNFVRCRTVTTWTGVVNGLTMPTTWILIYNGPTQTGFDFFTRFR